MSKQLRRDRMEINLRALLKFYDIHPQKGNINNIRKELEMWDYQIKHDRLTSSLVSFDIIERKSAGPRIKFSNGKMIMCGKLLKAIDSKNIVLIPKKFKRKNLCIEKKM